MSLPARGHRRIFGRGALWIVAISACASPGPSSGAPAPPASVEPSPSGSLSNEEIERIFRERTRASRTRYTAADVRFMTDMIHHHAQAIEISRFAETHGASPPIRTLAARIINAQTDEIRLMRRWLADRDRPAPEVHLETGHVLTRVGGGDTGHRMPGMLSPDQLRRLDAARGAEFDRLFLTFMIEHHEGAVVMVRELFSTDGAAQDEEAFRFASDVQVDQVTEVARMRSMLDGMEGSDPGP